MLKNKFLIAGLAVFAFAFFVAGAQNAHATHDTVQDGDVIRAEGEDDVYIVKFAGDKQFKRLIINPDIFNSYGHLSWDNIKTVDQAKAASFTKSQLITEVDANGNPVNGKVYQLKASEGSDTGTKHHIDMTAEQFVEAGYDFDAIYNVNFLEASDEFYPEGLFIAPQNRGRISADMQSGNDEVLAGSENEQVASFTLAANSTESVVLEKIVLRHIGTADSAHVRDLELRIDGTSVGSVRSSIDENDTVTFDLSQDSPRIGAGAVAEITVIADISAQASDSANVQFALNSFRSVEAVGTTSGGRASVVAAGTYPEEGIVLTVRTSGELTVDMSSSTGVVTAGGEDQAVAEFMLTASAAEGMIVKTLTLTEIGTVGDSALSNLALKVGGQPVSGTVAALAGGKVTFDLSSSPITLESDASKTVKLHADVSETVNTSSVVQFEITGASDVFAVGSQSASRAQVSSESFFPARGGEYEIRP